MHDTSYPPHRLISSRTVQPDEALSLISDYLLRADEDNSLHPNAKLTENGPTVHSAGESTGLVLHNLNRLRDGLKGEYYAAKASEDGLLVANGGLGPHERETEDEGQDSKGDAQFEWQNLSEFEQEQEDEEGDLGPRTSGVGMVDPQEKEDIIGVDVTEGGSANGKNDPSPRDINPKPCRQKGKSNGIVQGQIDQHPMVSKEGKKEKKKDRWKKEKARKALETNGTAAAG